VGLGEEKGEGVYKEKSYKKRKGKKEEAWKNILEGTLWKSLVKEIRCQRKGREIFHFNKE